MADQPQHDDDSYNQDNASTRAEISTENDAPANLHDPNAPAPQEFLVGQDRVGPSSKIWASRNNSGLGRINGSGLARAVGVYGRLRDLREPEVPGRANDGATTATD